MVFGFSNAETDSWSAPLTIVSLALSVALLVTFVVIERRAKFPLLPLHVVVDRARGGAYASIALAGSGVFGVFLFLTYYMQQNLGFSPLMTGVAFLPMTAVIVVTADDRSGTKLLDRIGAKPLITTGDDPRRDLDDPTHPALARRHLRRRRTAEPAGDRPRLWAASSLPPSAPRRSGVERNEAGVASAMVNTSQQVGGSVGTALLSTLLRERRHRLRLQPRRRPGRCAPPPQIHGYTTAFWWGGGDLRPRPC